MAKVRLLNPSGILKFEEYLESGETGRVPYDLLNNHDYTEDVHGAGDVFNDSVRSKFELAQHVGAALPGPFSEYNHQRGIWAWLALFFFDEICPSDPETGLRTIGETYRYIPGLYWRHYYRHLIKTPVFLAGKYGDEARCILGKDPHKGGDFIETIASRQDLVTNQGVISAISRLYYDTKNKRAKKGATHRARAGSVRRLVTVLDQLELTYDLFAMDGDQILGLLPEEFDGWKEGEWSTQEIQHQQTG